MLEEQGPLDRGVPVEPSRAPTFASLYAELRRLAGRELWGAGGFSGMGATTLVHETFLNIAGRPAIAFENRAHFLTYASRAMRGLIIDRARSASAEKRGGCVKVRRLDTELGEQLAEPEDVVGIGVLLDELGELDADLAQVVDLKFFCGFNFAEIARMRGCSERTVQRHWEQARLLLRRMAADAPT
jgi:RNA polymerase sigma factor (TIGR02999 family)